jgi:hypothetical protein
MMFVYHYLTNLIKMYSTIAFLFEQEIVDNFSYCSTLRCVLVSSDNSTCIANGTELATHTHPRPESREVKVWITT